MTIPAVVRPVLVLGLIFAVAALGEAAIFVGDANTNGYQYSAWAEFAEDSSGNLVVTLSNLATQDVVCPSQVLTAIFFSLGGNEINLSPGSALLGVNPEDLTASHVYHYAKYGLAPLNIAGGVVGGEWMYSVNTGVTPPSPSPTYAITSSGLGLDGTRFPGANLAGPECVDGVQYGITSAGDDITTGNGGIRVPLIKDTVVFTLTGLGDESPESVSQVRFQYGTDLSEPTLVVDGVGEGSGPVPEPATLVIWSVLGGLGIACGWRRKRKVA